MSEHDEQCAFVEYVRARSNQVPELRWLHAVPNGGARNITVAASNRKDETVWFRVSTWEKLAEICNQYLHKGSKVLVEGALKADAQGNPRTYERKDGTWGASFEVVASSVKFLSGKDEPADEVLF